MSYRGFDQAEVRHGSMRFAWPELPATQVSRNLILVRKIRPNMALTIAPVIAKCLIDILYM